MAYFTPVPALRINVRRVHRADSDAGGIKLCLSNACGAAGDIGVAPFLNVSPCELVFLGDSSLKT